MDAIFLQVGCCQAQQVTAITSATLSGLKTLRALGVLPQNVNYAVKIDYSLPMLSKAGIKIVAGLKNKYSDFSEIVKDINNSVVLVIAQ